MLFGCLQKPEVLALLSLKMRNSCEVKFNLKSCIKLEFLIDKKVIGKALSVTEVSNYRRISNLLL